MAVCIPGMMFCLLSSSTMVVPVVVFWYRVSSNIMAPEMYWPRPGVVHSSSRYACVMKPVSNPCTQTPRHNHNRNNARV